MKPLPVEGHVPASLLEPFRGKRVLITGANGFVGRWMHETLTDTDVDFAVCLAVVGRKGWENANGQQFDYVVHCTTDGDDLERAMELLAPGGRMLYLSSGAVYGEQTCREAYSEHRPAIPTTAYGAKKRWHEVLCREVAVVARMFSFVGPGLRRHTGKEFLENNPIYPNSDTSIRGYQYAGDMARWLWTVLLKGAVGQCYNVGSNAETRVDRFAGLCGKVRGVEVHYRLQTGGDYYVPDTSRAEHELRLRQEVNLEDAVRRTLAWQSGV